MIFIIFTKTMKKLKKLGIAKTFTITGLAPNTSYTLPSVLGMVFERVQNQMLSQ